MDQWTGHRERKRKEKTPVGHSFVPVLLFCCCNSQWPQILLFETVHVYYRTVLGVRWFLRIHNAEIKGFTELRSLLEALETNRLVVVRIRFHAVVGREDTFPRWLWSRACFLPLEATPVPWLTAAMDWVFLMLHSLWLWPCLSNWCFCLTPRLLRAPMITGIPSRWPWQALPGQLVGILTRTWEPLPSNVYISIWLNN